MVRWAIPGAVQEAIQRWNAQQVECRSFGHNWRSLTVFHRPGSYTITQRCQRCRNERTRDIDEQGRVSTGWSHTYRRGYLLEGLGRIDEDGRALLRLAVLDGMTIVEVTEEGD